MPASNKRIAVAAAVILLLALAGSVGWQRMRLPSPMHMVMSASVVPSPRAFLDPEAAPSSMTPPSSALVSEGQASGQSVTAERESAPQPPSAPVPASAQKVEPSSPSFDVVRVEPSGEALLAGHGEPNDTVALVDRGKVVAEAKTDAGGNFVMTPPALKPGDYALSLRVGQGSAARDSKQSVVVSVPATKKQQVVVAMAEPGKATTLLSAPLELTKASPAAPEPVKAPLGKAVPTTTRPSAEAPASPTRLAIRSVDLENGSGLFASGEAPPGTDVRVYLNNSRVADVIAAAAGSWTVTVRKGLAAGHYAVRADALKPNRTVGARVEVPFDVPPPMSVAAAPSAALATAGLRPQADALRSPAPTKKVAEAEPGRGMRSDAVSGSRPQASVQQQPPAPSRTVAKAEPSAGRSERSDTSSLEPAVQVPTPADAVVDELKTELVSRGDNLWRISRKRLGQGTRYTQIYAANTSQIRDPKLIYPGQVFVLPLQ